MSITVATDEDLKSELQKLVSEEFPSSPVITDYVSSLLVNPWIRGLEEVEIDCSFSEASDIETKREKTKDMSDKCLSICIFCLDDIEEKGMIGLTTLGKSGYRAAGFYSHVLQQKEDGKLYTRLSENFFPLVARLSYAVRKYLGDLEPPRRIILWTPHGETIFRTGYSKN